MTYRYCLHLPAGCRHLLVHNNVETNDLQVLFAPLRWVSSLVGRPASWPAAAGPLVAPVWSGPHHWRPGMIGPHTGNILDHPQMEG